MKTDYIQIDNILREASTVLKAALKHSIELSESGVTSQELLRMRLLITRLTLRSDIRKYNSNLSTELQELQNLKEIILRTAEQRFRGSSEVLGEFHNMIYRKIG